MIGSTASPSGASASICEQTSVKLTRVMWRTNGSPSSLTAARRFASSGNTVQRVSVLWVVARADVIQTADGNRRCGIASVVLVCGGSFEVLLVVSASSSSCDWLLIVVLVVVGGLVIVDEARRRRAVVVDFSPPPTDDLDIEDWWWVSGCVAAAIDTIVERLCGGGRWGRGSIDRAYGRRGLIGGRRLSTSFAQPFEPVVSGGGGGETSRITTIPLLFGWKWWWECHASDMFVGIRMHWCVR